ncbi:MAG: hypothetical protein MZV70_08105 [Desulfobacterales bacterium]|nr:hypothetical protein [Desulfobacterales bacterium]
MNTRRPHRRHLPAHLADAAQPRARSRSSRTTCSDQVHAPRSTTSPRRSSTNLELPGHRHPDPDRRRRHALVRRAAPPGGRQGRRHPQDHGQRRSGDRLLHRLLAPA